MTDPPHDQPPQPYIMQGYMMKKKQSTGGSSSRAFLRSVSLKWVTRYFILNSDGSIMYYKDRPENKSTNGQVLCHNVGDCTIDRVTAADLSGNDNVVANSFYITVPNGGGGGRMTRGTLLVTNGPEDFQKWILSFRKFEGSINVGQEISAAVDVAQDDVPPVVVEVGGAKEEEGGIPKEIFTSPITTHNLVGEPVESERGEDGNVDKGEEDNSADPPTNVEVAAGIESPKEESPDPIKNGLFSRTMNGFTGENPKEDFLEHEPDTTSEPRENKMLQAEESTTAVEKAGDPEIPNEHDGINISQAQESATAEGESREQEILIKNTEGDNEMPFAEALTATKADEAAPAVAPVIPAESDMDVEEVVKLLNDQRRKELQLLMKDKSLTKDIRKQAMDECKKKYASLIQDIRTGKYATAEEDKAALADQDAPKMEEEDTPGLSVPKISKEATKAAIDAMETKKEEVVVEKAAPGKNTEKLEAAESAIAELNGGPSNGAVVEENQQEVEEKPKNEGEMRVKVFASGDTFGEMISKVSEDDNENKELVGILVTSLAEMGAVGDSAEVSEITSKNQAFLVDLAGNNKPHHLKALERMFCENESSQFEQLHSIFYDEEEGTRDQIVQLLQMAKEKEVKAHQKLHKPIPELNNFSGEMTAYKQAEPTPTAEEVLGVVREPLGTPYNWVLFQPSKKDLIVEDAGSGGVIEMTKLLRESYNDRVLFGLMRITFIGDTHGRRQFWAGLEWKGEDCRSVKMKMQLTNCLKPMKMLIGESSFALSNLTADQMTLEEVVDRVKRSCNVTDFDATVKTLLHGLEEEQKAIREYWKRVQNGRQEEEDNAKKAAEEEEEMRKKFHGDVHGLRRWRWSRMSATELLQDIGKDNFPHWVLLEVDVPLI